MAAPVPGGCGTAPGADRKAGVGCGKLQPSYSYSSFWQVTAANGGSESQGSPNRWPQRPARCAARRTGPAAPPAQRPCSTAPGGSRPGGGENACGTWPLPLPFRCYAILCGRRGMGAGAMPASFWGRISPAAGKTGRRK